MSVNRGAELRFDGGHRFAGQRRSGSDTKLGEKRARLARRLRNLLQTPARQQPWRRQGQPEDARAGDRDANPGKIEEPERLASCLRLFFHRPEWDGEG